MEYQYKIGDKGYWKQSDPEDPTMKYEIIGIYDGEVKGIGPLLALAHIEGVEPELQTNVSPDELYPPGMELLVYNGSKLVACRDIKAGESFDIPLGLRDGKWERKAEDIFDTPFALPWDRAPDWAEWAAMDGTKRWYWYSGKPMKLLSNRSWVMEGTNCQYEEFKLHTLNPLGRISWKESLQKRPKGQEKPT